MKVEILNSEEVKDIFFSWGNVSATCYNTKNVPLEKIGKNCLISGHFSGGRSKYILFRITGVSRAIVDQLARHEVGVIKNVQSTRYVDKSNFQYETPREILGDVNLTYDYIEHMKQSKLLYDKIQNYIIENGKSKERANEQARLILPLGIHSEITIGFTVEALIHYMNVRLCKRAEEEHRYLAKLMKLKVIMLLPELEDYLVPQCQKLMYCPETRGCGAYPNKEDVAKLIELGKINKIKCDKNTREVKIK